ncbi:hypothetical protein C5167_024968 [Papaver somniferum]|uniref:Uncharacterized protein n=1 Tax=Papaver somniferum TaxID=3469 RepID=A0A4Y7JRS4_PAPSO|nr:hypothetical protein C5167_024968 [Papaver somniferum]
MPIDLESRRLIDWMGESITLSLTTRTQRDLHKYLNCKQDYLKFDPSLVPNGNRKQGATFKSMSIQTLMPNQTRSSAWKMIRTLVQLMQTLDRMPEVALCHVLPLEYITISKLQIKLEGEVNQATLRKLLCKMACGGFVGFRNGFSKGTGCSSALNISMVMKPGTPKYLI